MTEISKLAIFDVDGTLATHGVIPDSVLDGLMHLREIGYATTISTGRGYIRAKESLAEKFDKIISPEALLIIEHGTKVVDRNGQIQYSQDLSIEEINHIIDFSKVNLGMIRLIWFNPPDPTQRVQVWCYDASLVKEETEKRGHYADVFTSSFDDLKAKMLAQSISNVTAKLREFVKVENLKLHFTRTEIDTIFQDGNMEFVSNLADKAKAIDFIEKHYSVPFDNVLIAGNAINDVEMLNLEVGKRVLVGPSDERSVVLGYLTKPDEVVSVENPEALGTYLQNI